MIVKYEIQNQVTMSRCKDCVTNIVIILVCLAVVGIGSVHISCHYIGGGGDYKDPCTHLM